MMLSQTKVNLICLLTQVADDNAAIPIDFCCESWLDSSKCYRDYVNILLQQKPQKNKMKKMTQPWKQHLNYAETSLANNMKWQQRNHVVRPATYESEVSRCSYFESWNITVQ
jgi:hypothetical protein